MHNIVWFKRDLRIEDHKALTQAAQNGSVFPLYIFEPELWHQPDMSYRHYVFLKESLDELNQALRKIGQELIIKVGNAIDVLAELNKKYCVKALWSHQETWNGWTYERDEAVRKWCKLKNIPWYEPVQNGVIRGLKDRDGWSAHWYHQMQTPIIYPPTYIPTIDEHSQGLPTHTALGLEADKVIDLQRGGRSAGLQALHTFLYNRGEGYSQEMSSPVTAFNSCSRLSTHLAFGTLSIREVFQACEQRKRVINELATENKGNWPSAMRSFSSRLRWHCHFIQKLEDEPSIEFQNMHTAYDGLRETDFNERYFSAWATGQTGYPMVDACMRALVATGWINFRMRAMLMSFASYHLWLHWRKPALHLAKLFTDYEPGIHYSQVQMQSGTTGINTIRIYNPIKQSLEQDSAGMFILQWIPELRNIDTTLLHTPWLANPPIDGYPMPIIDEGTARKLAAERIYTLRKNHPYHKAIAQAVTQKHGSRKSSLPKTGLKPKSKSDTNN